MAGLLYYQADMDQIVTTSTKNYKLGKILGQGLNSCVYKATCIDSEHIVNHLVALKILKSAQFTRMWKNEFESLARVSSSNCVRVLAFEKLADGQLALVLEYIDGVTLRDFVAVQNLTADVIDGLFHQIHTGLLDLRSKGLSHGDLSPGNVMIDIYGQVKLLDFGFGNHLVKEETHYCTLDFSAPELLQGRSWHYWSDLWSLGKLLQYTVDVGRYEGGKFKQQIAALLVEAPVGRRWNVGKKTNLHGAKQSLSTRVTRRQGEIKQWTENTSRLALSHKSEVVVRSMTQGKFKLIKVQWSRQKGVKLLIWIILLILPGMWNHSETQGALKTAMIVVRTKYWVMISIDGQQRGYAPTNVKGLEAGIHQVDWKSYRGSGSRQIYLKTGEVRRLKDPFFFSPKL